MTPTMFCILFVIELIIFGCFAYEVPDRIRDSSMKRRALRQEFIRGYSKALRDILERGYYCDEFGNRHKIEVKNKE